MLQNLETMSTLEDSPHSCPEMKTNTLSVHGKDSKRENPRSGKPDLGWEETRLTELVLGFGHGPLPPGPLRTR